MNVRLQYDLDFVAGVYLHDKLWFNNYSLVINLLTQTKSSVNSNIAMERLKSFVCHELSHTVFLGPADHHRADHLMSLGIDVTTLPEEPMDQIVGLMLFTKLNAVMEGRMLITDLDIQSTLSDNVWYMHNEDEPLGPFAQDGWWQQANRQHNHLTSVDHNVVKVSAAGWNEWDLLWPESAIANNGNTVLYASFTQNENQQPQ